MLNTVKRLCKIRKDFSCLNPDGLLDIESYGNNYIIYKRNDNKNSIKVIIKTGKGEKSFKMINGKILFSNNTEIYGDTLKMQNFAFAIILI